VIDFSWTMRGNHVLKVVAHASAPMSADPGFRQYDFFVDGRSFFSFPKVYRLGLSGSKTVSHDSRERRPERGGGYPAIEHSGSSSRRKESDIAQIEAPHNPDEASFFCEINFVDFVFLTWKLIRVILRLIFRRRHICEKPSKLLSRLKMLENPREKILLKNPRFPLRPQTS